MTKKPKQSSVPTKEPVVQQPQPAVPQWIEQMHMYFQHTGYYRPADVRRVLGDASVSIKGSATQSVFVNFAPPKRTLVGG